MTPNPLLKALGLSDNDRAVLIHTDDIGMCHASLAAYADLSKFGLISAGSTMVPCPWFPATAQYCAANPGTVDMGVHITLTSEWDTGYRWGPVSTRDPASGLLDAEGYLHRTTAATQAHATPAAARIEMATQIRRALDAGIDVTHVDTHMGTVFYPGFLQAYLETALEHRLPPFLVRNTDEARRKVDIADGDAAKLVDFLRELNAQGLPMLDYVGGIPFDSPDSHMAAAQATLSDLKPGLTYLIIHPSKDTPELRAILPGGWQTRVGEYNLFMREELRAFIKDQGIHVITWRMLRDVMRAKL